MDYQTIAILTGLLGLCLGYWLQGRLNTKYKRKRIWRVLKCGMGFHLVGPIREDSMGVTQRCDYCGNVVRVYDKDEDGFYRRVR